MTKTFTENDLVRFIYGELNKNKCEELRQALLTDEELLDKLSELKKTIGKLEGVSIAPSQRTVAKILEFSKGYQSSLPNFRHG